MPSVMRAAVAESLNVAQPEISRIEHQADLLLSTLGDYVAALGGELSLVARFGDADPVDLELSTLYSDDSESTLEPVVLPDPALVLQLGFSLGGLAEKERRFHEVDAA